MTCAGADLSSSTESYQRTSDQKVAQPHLHIKASTDPQVEGEGILQTQHQPDHCKEPVLQCGLPWLLSPLSPVPGARCSGRQRPALAHRGGHYCQRPALPRCPGPGSQGCPRRGCRASGGTRRPQNPKLAAGLKQGE